MNETTLPKHFLYHLTIIIPSGDLPITVDMHTADIKMVPAKSPTPPPLPPPFNPYNENTTSNNKQQETDIPSLPFLLDDMGTAEMDSRVNQEEIDCEG